MAVNNDELRIPVDSADGGADVSSERRSAGERTGRTGRRRGSSESRRDILATARSQFAQLGYERTTLRGIAKEAMVDPALIHYFFASKEGVFSAAVREAGRTRLDIAQIVRPGPESVGRRLARACIDTWESSDRLDSLMAVARSAATHEQAALLLREYVREDVLDCVELVVGGRDAEQRAAVIAAQLFGAMLLRHVVRVEPMASMPRESLLDCLVASVDFNLRAEIPGTAGPE